MPSKCIWTGKNCDTPDVCFKCDVLFNKYAEEVKRGLNAK